MALTPVERAALWTVSALTVLLLALWLVHVRLVSYCRWQTAHHPAYAAATFVRGCEAGL